MQAMRTQEAITALFEGYSCQQVSLALDRTTVHHQGTDLRGGGQVREWNGFTHPDASARMQQTETFCFRGMFRPHSITTGMRTSTPSVEIFSTACASAMSLRQVPMLTLSGLHGPEMIAVKAIVSLWICLCQPLASYQVRGWS